MLTNFAHIQIFMWLYLSFRLKRISSITVREDCKLAYIGTEGGNIYMLDIPKFEVTDKIIYLDVVLQK